MFISMIPKYNIISIDGVTLKCEYNVASNIEFAFFDDKKEKGKISYNNKTKNQTIAEMPFLDILLPAYWLAYSIKLLPSKYHSWDMDKKEFFVSKDNQDLKDSDKAKDFDIKAVNKTRNDKRALNPITNLNPEEVIDWLRTHPDTALEHIVNLLILRN